jgi:hypothetical protein
MATEITLDELRARAERAGIELTEEELTKLLPGVNRSFKQARELRELVSAADEPASAFSAARSQREQAK